MNDSWATPASITFGVVIAMILHWIGAPTWAAAGYAVTLTCLTRIWLELTA